MDKTPRKKYAVVVVQLYVPGAQGGVYSTYAQQYQQLREKGEDRPDVFKHYFQDLNRLLENYGDCQKVLMGDFNQVTDDREIIQLQELHDL